MYDDLTTLMLDATDALVPPPAAASRALRSAARSRKRNALLAGTGGVAAVGLVAAGVTQLPGSQSRRSLSVAAPPSAPVDSPAPAVSPADDHSPSQLQSQAAEPVSQDAAFNALTLPNTLPGFPFSLFDHPNADSFQSGDNNKVFVGPGPKTISAPVRLWGWNHGAYIPDAAVPGSTGNSEHPDGPQLRLDIVDRPDVYLPRADGTIAGTTVNGPLLVRGKPAFVSHDSSDIYVSLTYDGYSIQAMGGNGATVDDLVMSINAIEGLDGTGTDAPASSAAAASAAAAPSPTAYATLVAPTVRPKTLTVTPDSPTAAPTQPPSASRGSSPTSAPTDLGAPVLASTAPPETATANPTASPTATATPSG